MSFLHYVIGFAIGWTLAEMIYRALKRFLR